MRFRNVSVGFVGASRWGKGFSRLLDLITSPENGRFWHRWVVRVFLFNVAGRRLATLNRKTWQSRSGIRFQVLGKGQGSGFEVFGGFRVS